MEKLSLELMYKVACDFYDEFEIKQRTSSILSYTVHVNDFNIDTDMFKDNDIPISLCYNKKFEYCYIECFNIKQQVSFNTFDTLKKHFIDKYFSAQNNNNKGCNQKIHKLFNNMKEKRDKQRIAILSEIIDIDVENIDTAQDIIHQMIRDQINNRIIIH